jgi:hypothetical protein
MFLELSVKPNFGIFLHNPKLCTYYKHWIHNCNKTMKQFYISTNKTYVLNLIGRGTPTNGKVFYHSYLCHGVTLFSFPLIHENKKEK